MVSRGARLVICIDCRREVALGLDRPHSCSHRENSPEVEVDQLVGALKAAGVVVDGRHAAISFDLGDDFSWVLIARGEENLSLAKIRVFAYNRSLPKFRWAVEEFWYYRHSVYKEEEKRWRVAPAQKHFGGAGIKALTQSILTFLDPEHDPAS